jgi:uncharacterized protein (TIGR03435 family)
MQVLVVDRVGKLIENSEAVEPTTEKSPAFAAASIKPTSPNLPNGAMVFGMLEPIGGPGTGDPGRIRYPVISLKSLFIDAFRVKGYQIEGPDWLDTQWFEIKATMPEDTTREQLSVMLQNLLENRFGLRMHRMTKDVSGYALVVSNTGPKLQSPAEASGAQESDGPINWEEHGLSADGFRILPSQLTGRAGLWFFKGLRGCREVFHQQTMQTLAGSLSTLLGQPIIDATALTAKYDFTLTYTPDDFQMGTQRESFPRIFDALPSQLGLRLEPKKLPAEAILVDHIEKAPREN